MTGNSAFHVGSLQSKNVFQFFYLGTFGCRFVPAILNPRFGSTDQKPFSINLQSKKRSFQFLPKINAFTPLQDLSFLLSSGCGWLGFALGVCSGAAKEYRDSRGHGCVELLDFVFTVIGALIAFALTFFFLSPFIHSLFKL
jgi:hypothetical protein